MYTDCIDANCITMDCINANHVDAYNRDTIFCDTLDRAYEYAQAILSLEFDNVKSSEGSSDTPVCLVYLQNFSWCQWHAR